MGDYSLSQPQTGRAQTALHLHHPCVHPTKVVDEAHEGSVHARAPNEPCKEALTSAGVASCDGLGVPKPHC